MGHGWCSSRKATLKVDSPVTPLRISIVIPALNEVAGIAEAVQRARATGAFEVIVVDGGSTDGTINQAEDAGATVVQSDRGRAIQQNAGADAATGDVLLFLHADNWLTPEACEQIRTALRSTKAVHGAFHQKIEAPGRIYRWLEAGNAYRVRRWGLPYGDQAIFILRDQFQAEGGFPEEPLMEDYILMRQLRRSTRPVLLDGPLHVSARRWQKHGALMQTFRNWFIIMGYHLGVPPARLARLYQRHDLGNRKEGNAGTDASRD